MALCGVFRSGIYLIRFDNYFCHYLGSPPCSFILFLLFLVTLVQSTPLYVNQSRLSIEISFNEELRF